MQSELCCSAVNFNNQSICGTVSSETPLLHPLSVTLQRYSLVDLAEVAGVLWQQEYPCGQSVGSEAKPVRSNSSPILFHPREKPFMFQLDTHGWTEVSEDGWFGVCTSGRWGWELTVRGCVCVSVCVKLTLFWYSCYYHTWALPPPLPPLTHTRETLSSRWRCKV